MRGLGDLAIVAGAKWRCDGVLGEFGSQGVGEGVPIELPSSETGVKRQFEVVLHTREALSPAFLWHFKLLIGLAAEFYWAKQREQKLAQDNYMRAVHEAGARLTHDVKNLLQSIDGLVDAANSNADDFRVRKLIGRQLPAVSQRLAATLARLGAPSTDSQRMLQLGAWWLSLCQRHAHADLRFQRPDIVEDLPIHEALFDGAADNLIQNALRKRSGSSSVVVSVALASRGGVVEFSVEDTGEPMPVEIADRLFKSTLPSRDGMGIGLYQLATKAQQYGYRLELTHNFAGRVRILLTNRPIESGAAPLEAPAKNTETVGGSRS
jgi:signal transduction histidine kinase